MKDSPEPNIEELKPDVRNANRGTERGREMLRESIRRFGKGRADEAVRACGDVEIEFPEGFMEAEEDAREPEI